MTDYHHLRGIEDDFENDKQLSIRGVNFGLSLRTRSVGLTIQYFLNMFDLSQYFT